MQYFRVYSFESALTVSIIFFDCSKEVFVALVKNSVIFAVTLPVQILGFTLSTVRPRYHCIHFQILHAIYSQLSSLTSC